MMPPFFFPPCSFYFIYIVEDLKKRRWTQVHCLGSASKVFTTGMNDEASSLRRTYILRYQAVLLISHPISSFTPYLAEPPQRRESQPIVDELTVNSSLSLIEPRLYLGLSNLS